MYPYRPKSSLTEARKHLFFCCCCAVNDLICQQQYRVSIAILLHKIPRGSRNYINKNSMRAISVFVYIFQITRHAILCVLK